MTEPYLLPALLETGNSPDAEEAPNERYDCLRCETSMAPEDLRARVVLATFHEPAYTEFVCPWCGGEVEPLHIAYQLEQIIDHNTPDFPGDRS